MTNTYLRCHGMYLQILTQFCHFTIQFIVLKNNQVFLEDIALSSKSAEYRRTKRDECENVEGNCEEEFVSRTALFWVIKQFSDTLRQSSAIVHWIYVVSTGKGRNVNVKVHVKDFVLMLGTCFLELDNLFCGMKSRKTTLTVCSIYILSLRVTSNIRNCLFDIQIFVW